MSLNIAECFTFAGCGWGHGRERPIWRRRRAARQAGHRVYLLHDQEREPGAVKDYDGAIGIGAFFDSRSLRRGEAT